jgi:mono/diheme cytochrome c family protein
MFAILFAWLVNSAGAYAQPEKNAARGELLYSTHCISCHSTEIHWRDKKLATDWLSLQAEVRRWQGIAGLGWHDDDITGVARYLNVLYYHYPEHIHKSGPASNSSQVLGSSRTASPPDQRRP